MEKNNKTTLFLSQKSINKCLKVEKCFVCFLLNKEAVPFFFLVYFDKNILQAVCQVSFQNKNFNSVSQSPEIRGLYWK